MDTEPKSYAFSEGKVSIPVSARVTARFDNPLLKSEKASRCFKGLGWQLRGIVQRLDVVPFSVLQES